MGTGWWVTDQWNNGPIYLGSWVFWALLSVVLHELAHGWAAIRRGDFTPHDTGHMTWNPAVHVDTFGWIAFGLFGVPWGRMPIDPSRIRGRYGLAAVAVAGPATNFGLSVLSLIGLVAWIKFAGAVREPVRGNVLIFLNTGAWLNMVLMVFNLIPVPPLDGWRIVSNFSRRFEEIWEGERGAIFRLIAFLVVFSFAGRHVVRLAQKIIGAILSFLL